MATATSETKLETTFIILKRKRNAFRVNAERLMGAVCDEDIDHATLQARLTNLIDVSRQLDNVDKDILDLVLQRSTDDNEVEEEVINASSFKERIDRTRALMEQRLLTLDKVTCRSNSNVGSSGGMALCANLPKLSLEKFDLSAHNWLSWWAQFRSIDESEDFDEAVKFQYLKMTLSGPARVLVDSYPNTSGNYHKVIDHLKQRYGRDELIINCMYRDLLTLVKSHLSLTDLYDKISSRIRSLATIGISSQHTAILVPLIEECLPLETRKLWERRCISSEIKDINVDSLLEFLCQEAECEERLNLNVLNESLEPPKSTVAALVNSDRKGPSSSNKPYVKDKPIVESSSSNCIFCQGPHRSKDCSLSLTVEQRREIAKTARVCFACLLKGHSIKQCRFKVFCSNCKGRHLNIMCLKNVTTTANLIVGPFVNETVILKTLIAFVSFKEKRMLVRILLDSASHRSYVSSRICKSLNLPQSGEESLKHMLFGGQITELTKHSVHPLVLLSVVGSKRFDILALQQENICGPIPTVSNKALLHQIKNMDISLADDGLDRPIDVLIGADHLGRLLTGSIKCVDPKLLALETVLGWCLLGTIETEVINPSICCISPSLVCLPASLPSLWDLETIGIEPTGTAPLKAEKVKFCFSHFTDNVSFENGRYKVALPWIANHPPLLSNYELAFNRLRSVDLRLRRDQIWTEYDTVFRTWEQENIIEIVETDDKEGHYLAHRPVIREGRTTKIRPVFDGSAKTENGISLNDCLSPGPNLISQTIPLLLQFRKESIGLTADIKQAFLMIELRLDSDKNMLKFLWFRNDKIVTFRHCRVVFGLAPSPFLLNATLRHHLLQFDTPVAKKLMSSFYVDDCIVSLSSIKEAEHFILEACKLLGLAQFELRGWVKTGDTILEHQVLGLNWSPLEDTLSCYFPKEENYDNLTKRKLLSLVARIYDPLGFVAAPLLTLKVILQECFKLRLSWNETLPQPLLKRGLQWVKEIQFMSAFVVPRFMQMNSLENTQLHVFCDASKLGFGVCIFLRIELLDSVSVSYVMGKARVSPLAPTTIPRLELIAAVLAARLGNTVSLALNITQIFYWTDSMISLQWISKGEWQTFVGNRVKEIRSLTNPAQWFFIEGSKNPADLLSRGCSLKEYALSRWIEGPTWLKRPASEWPEVKPIFKTDFWNEYALSTLVAFSFDKLLFSYFSSFKRNIRLMGWLLRFLRNCRKSPKFGGDLSAEEMVVAEERLIWWIQNTWKPPLDGLSTIVDKSGTIRVCSKILQKQIPEAFRWPIVLTTCPLIESLIREKHVEMYHAGVCWVLNHLREKIWLIRGRQVVRKVLRNCIPCKRQRGKPIVVPTVGLPTDRTHLGKVFATSGCDLMGPLYLKEGSKVWIVIFTCAVYRAVHLEIVNSLSTEAFLLCLRRFIARRGRISTLYTDNGTNFVGAWNWLNASSVENLKIQWKFNVPTGSWWGGFFERLIGVFKMLLKTTLSKALLNVYELNTVVVELESVLNNRPITYVYNDVDEPSAITPSMFLQEETNVDVSDLNQVDANSFSLRLKYISSLRQQLKARFMQEYLGALLLKSEKTLAKFPQVLSVGAIVWIESSKKRVDWELGRIVELIPGKDGIVRVVRLKTQNCEILRPVQRLILLEGITPSQIEPNPDSLNDSTSTDTQCIVRTRYGRLSRQPNRYQPS